MIGLDPPQAWLRRRSLLGSDLGTFAQGLMAVLLTLYPLFYMTIRSWTNGILFLSAALAIAFFLRRPQALRESFLQSSEAIAVSLTLWSMFAGVLIGQLLRHELDPSALDGPVRMVLASVIFLCLLQIRANLVGGFQLIVPLSLLIAVVVVHAWPQAST